MTYQKSGISFLNIAICVLLITTAFSPSVVLQDEGKNEEPLELTDEEYQKDVDAFYQSNPDLQVVLDLKDPDGIDPSLLPSDVKAIVEAGATIVAYKETVGVAGPEGKTGGLARLCVTVLYGIGCASPSGSRDLTTSQVFGSVTQFARTIAVRYDNFSGCSQNCFGWEVDKQYMWWTRSNSTWNVKNGVMRTYITAENYCTEGSATLDYGSTTIAQPTWSGNQTSKYSISGFPNIAYVPNPPNTGWSRTQGDIYQGTTLHTNDARNNQFWPTY